MSRSITLRPILISEALRAAIRDQMRASCASELLDQLRHDTRLACGSLLEQSGATNRRGLGQSSVEQRIAQARTADEMRNIVVDVARNSLPAPATLSQKRAGERLTGPPPGYIGVERGGELANAILAQPNRVILLDEIDKAPSSVFRPKSSSRLGSRAPSAPSVASAVGARHEPAVELAALQFDLKREAAELRSIRRVAKALEVDADLRPLSKAIEAAVTALHAGDVGAARTEVARVSELRQNLDQQVEDALVAAERRQRAVAAVTATLSAMGFTATVSADGTQVFARRSDGQEAVLEIEGDDAEVLRQDFTDPATTVADGEPGADDVCVPAVLSAEEYHRMLTEFADGIEFGNVRAVEKPTRGSGARHRARTARSRTGRAEGRTRAKPS